MKDTEKSRKQLIDELQALRKELDLRRNAQARELADIASVMQALNTTLDLDEVVKRVMDALNHVIDFNQVSIYLFNSERNTLEVTNWYGEGVSEELMRKFRDYPLSIEWEDVYFIKCFLDSEPKIITNITPELLRQFGERDARMFRWNPHRAIGIFPLEVQDKVIGVINFVHTEKPFRIHREDVYRIRRYVAAIATTINNAYLVRKTRYALEKSQAREREIAHLNQVIRATNATLDFDEVFQAISEGLRDVFQFEAVGIQLVDRERELLNIYKVYGEVVTEALIERWRSIPISTDRHDSASSWVYATGEPFYFPAITPDLPFTETDRKLFSILPFSAYLACPLVVQNEVIGVISFFRREKHFHLGEQDLERIMRYVAAVATAIRNALHHEQLRENRRGEPRG